MLLCMVTMVIIHDKPLSPVLTDFEALLHSTLLVTTIAYIVSLLYDSITVPVLNLVTLKI